MDTRRAALFLLACALGVSLVACSRPPPKPLKITLPATALPVAARAGDAEAVRKILAGGAAPDMKDQAGYPAIARAAAMGHTAVIMALLEAGADVEASGPDGDTPLLSAVRKGKSAAAMALIQAGANPAARNSVGFSALHMAAHQNDVEVITALAAAGTDPNVLDAKSRTALTIAALRGNLEAIETLLAVGTDPNLGTQGPVAAAASVTNGAALVGPLVKGGADLTKQAPAALLTAINLSRLDFVKALIDAGADVNAPLPNGGTPLQLATRLKKQDLARILLDAGAKESAQAGAERDGEPPLGRREPAAPVE